MSDIFATLEGLSSYLNLFILIVYGLIVGSFLNVVIVRLPKRKSVIKPRSRCVHCKYKIPWYDNIPIISYVILLGRCRKCKKKISIRYPIVEIITALLFVAAQAKFGWSLLLLVRDLPFLCMLIVITFIDLELRIIPDELSIGGLALGLGTAYWVPELGLMPSVLGAAIGFTLFYVLAWLYLNMKGQSGMGGGDIKLLAMIGSFVGPSGVITTILLSSILGSVIGILWAISQKEKNLMKVAIPYGPFLVIGALFYYLLGWGFRIFS
jgi:leader peptidase (prepilin peptidase) / N-methyltransferase